MRIIVIASGSNGNSTYIESEGTNFLIDCGVTYKCIKERLEEFNVNIEDLQNVFITHEHIDHVKGLSILANKIPSLKVYLTKGTYQGLKYETKERLKNVCYVGQSDDIKMGNLNVKLIRTHHDVKEPFGLVITEGEKKLVYITDTGFIEEKFFMDISNADFYIMESNYDVDVLFSSDRPFELKERINSDLGHLSNYDSALILAKVMGPRTKRILFAHISEDCNFYNLPQLILKTHLDIYDEFGLDREKIEFVFGNRHGATGEYYL